MFKKRFQEFYDAATVEGGAGAEGNPVVEGVTGGIAEPQPGGAPSEPVEPKTYTQEELDKLLQSNADKIRTEYTKKIKEKEREHLTEAEKERLAFEDEKAQLMIEKEEFTKAQMLNKATDILEDNSLPISFKHMVIGKDEETTQKNIEKLKTEFNQAVESEIAKRFKGIGGDIPASGGLPKGYTQEDLAKMSDEEYYNLRKKQK